MSTVNILVLGRLVYGNLYEPKAKTNNDGTPKIDTKTGEPMVSFDYGLAVAKGTEGAWWETTWGQAIAGVGVGAFPGGESQRPDFAWKVHDGDSQMMNKANKRNCDKPGYAGHWILNFSSSYPSKYFKLEGHQPESFPAVGAIKIGYYVEISGSIKGNGSSQSPGIYLNHSILCLRSVYDEIVTGPDPMSAGFGQNALPQGVTMTMAPTQSMAPLPGQTMINAQPGLPGQPAGNPPVMPGQIAPMPGQQPMGNVPAQPAMQSAPQQQMAAQPQAGYAPPAMGQAPQGAPAQQLPGNPPMGNPHPGMTAPPAGLQQHPGAPAAQSATQATSAPGAYHAAQAPGNVPVQPVQGYGIPQQ
jgi:hypothetical protein